MALGRRLFVIVCAAAVLAGCSSSAPSPEGADDSEIVSVQDFVRDGYGQETNTIVRAVTCTRDDADHFSCALQYETPEGLTDTTTVSVTCDADRCVWRAS